MFVTGGKDKLNSTSGAPALIAETAMTAIISTDLDALLSRVPGVCVRQEEGHGLRPNINLRGIIEFSQPGTDQSWIQIFHGDTQKHTRKQPSPWELHPTGPLFDFILPFLTLTRSPTTSSLYKEHTRQVWAESYTIL